MTGSGSDDEHVYTFGPSVKATPQRWRARFDSLYQAEYCAKTAAQVKITREDYAKYDALNPAESEKLKRMSNATKLTGLGTALGFFGGGFQVFRWTRSSPLLVVGTMLSTLGGHVVADDIGGWIYGTYKFDTAGTSRKFLEWVVEERKVTGHTA